jgi:hypothetical protein
VHDARPWDAADGVAVFAVEPRRRGAPGPGEAEDADLATEAFDDIKRSGGEPTPDQKLALAQIHATLSVSQELSGMIEDKGLSVRIEDGKPSEQFGAKTSPKEAPSELENLRTRVQERIPTRSTHLRPR